MNKTNFSAIYSYSVEFGNSGTLSFGVQGGLTNRKIDFDRLVFYDQLNNSGIITGGVTSASPPEFNDKYFFDSGTGINVITGNLMFGAAAHHLNQPNESFTGTRSNLPLKLTGHLSYKFALDPFDDENTPSVTPSVLYYAQANFKSISAGLQVKRKGINMGLWYRGLSQQPDAIVFSLIFDLFDREGYDDKIRLGISHDATTSKLGYDNSAGSTEGALVYETTIFNNPDGGKKHYQNGSKKCYDFY